MSYSECFACGRMVGGYEKWCDACLEAHKLRQGDWRSFRPKTKYGTPERIEEIGSEIVKDSI